ncbi:MAG: preprotein translocase subunit SecG [Pleurocapsa sp. SU_196_0]|nr:preprotein translocase subunit SecG [Pleurocapsa sp. SU_196_0]
MNILFVFVLIIFCAICVGLIYFVLSQEPKQGGLSSSMGGGGGNDFFNARGSGGQLVQLTFYALGLFMALALILSIFRL